MKQVVRTMAVLAACASLGHAPAASGQDKPVDYPTRPIRILISVAPGGGADMVARMSAEILQKTWRQNVIVDARPGGGGVVATNIAARAEPDGYTLYQISDTLLMQGAAKRVEFDVLKVFQPVARLTEQPYILVVHPRVSASSLQELIALSRNKTLS